MRSRISASETDLLDQLRQRSPKPIASLTLTDNRTRIASARPTPEGLAVRVHRSFAPGGALAGPSARPSTGPSAEPSPGADPALVEAIVVAVIAPETATPRALRLARLALREGFARGTRGSQAAHAPADRQPSSRRLEPPRSGGRVHDLGALLDRLLREPFFAAQASQVAALATTDLAITDLAIVWSRWPSVPAGKARRLAPRTRRAAGRASLRLGSYTAAEHRIRIHPVLDHPDVPAFVVASIIRHEMLHAVVPPDRRPGSTRRRVHPPMFRRTERTFPDHERSERWLESRTDWLVERRDRGPEPGDADHGSEPYRARR